MQTGVKGCRQEEKVADSRKWLRTGGKGCGQEEMVADRRKGLRTGDACVGLTVKQNNVVHGIDTEANKEVVCLERMKSFGNLEDSDNTEAAAPQRVDGSGKWQFR